MTNSRLGPFIRPQSFVMEKVTTGHAYPRIGTTCHFRTALQCRPAAPPLPKSGATAGAQLHKSPAILGLAEAASEDHSDVSSVQLRVSCVETIFVDLQKVNGLAAISTDPSPEKSTRFFGERRPCRGVASNKGVFGSSMVF